VFGITDEEALAAAVLHDTIEDTLADRDDLIEHFGPRVAEFVALLSKDKRLPNEEREQCYLESLRDCPLEVKLLKVADLYDNLIDSSELPEQLRIQKIAKARDVLQMYDQDFPEPWRRVLDVLREQMRAVEATLGQT
jgi:(p)ppGpp synthase/HD superfamily hydrolase